MNNIDYFYLNKKRVDIVISLIFLFVFFFKGEWLRRESISVGLGYNNECFV